MNIKKIIELTAARAELFKPLLDDLKSYGLIVTERSEQDFNENPLCFNLGMLDLGLDHRGKVSIWLDYLTTRFVEVGKETILMNETGTPLHVRMLLMNTLTEEVLCDESENGDFSCTGAFCPRCGGSDYDLSYSPLLNIKV